MTTSGPTPFMSASVIPILGLSVGLRGWVMNFNSKYEYNFTLFFVFKNFVNLTFELTPIQLVRAKKFLGQHFLNDQNIAQRIVESLAPDPNSNVLEIGPGTGVLTKFLVADKGLNLKVIEIDWYSVAHLKKHYP